jgi:hypothetical protein
VGCKRLAAEPGWLHEDELFAPSWTHEDRKFALRPPGKNKSRGNRMTCPSLPSPDQPSVGARRGAGCIAPLALRERGRG